MHEQVREVAMNKATIRVPDMVCESCVAAIKKALEARPGIRGVSVDLVRKSVEAEYDDSAVTVADIRTAIEDAGFSPEE